MKAQAWTFGFLSLVLSLDKVEMMQRSVSLMIPMLTSCCK